MNVNINIDPAVIAPVYRPYLINDTYLQIFFGGSSSGKSYFLAQRCLIDMLKGGHNYLICRKAATALRKSVYNEVVKAISRMGLSKLFDINKSDMTITCKNGYQIIFSGLDDSEKIKGVTPKKGVVTDIWIEEATDCVYEDVKQLRKRLRGQSKVKKRLIMSFNPIFQQHWIFQEYFANLGWTNDSKQHQDEHLCILKTTYRDNPFLTAETIYDLENEADPYWKSVYSCGNFGILGHAIYTNWTSMDLSGREWETYCNGLDFGYGTGGEHPAAIVRCHYEPSENTLYVPYAKYLFSMTNDLLVPELQEMCESEVVVADCARPDNIADLRRRGINIVPCRKGPDSVLFGIQWLQKCRIVVDVKCTELIGELSVYHWKEDKATGAALPEPVKKQDDLLDALRYSLMYEMFKTETSRPQNKHIKWPTAGSM